MRDKTNKLIKGLLVGTFVLAATLAFWVPEPGAAAMSKTMPGKMVLDDPDKQVTEFAGDYGKVPFDHQQHVDAKPVSGQGAKESCVTCHHTNTKKLTEAVEEDVLKCTVCHKGEETTNEIDGTNEDKKFKGLKSVNSEEAYHGNKKQVDHPNTANAGCIACHNTMDQKPKSCKECHNGK
ncbi:MAG: cytochrome c3 family protein [Blastocatellia bacterium]|nr:cytochrome c3 family protein [Blastocatellia bacterium]